MPPAQKIGMPIFEEEIPPGRAITESRFKTIGMAKRLFFKPRPFWR
jgi:hypothetical protein